jgi:hypothetical protein
LCVLAVRDRDKGTLNSPVVLTAGPLIHMKRRLGAAIAVFRKEVEALRLLLAERAEAIRDLRARLDREAEERCRVQERPTATARQSPTKGQPFAWRNVRQYANYL